MHHKIHVTDPSAHACQPSTAEPQKSPWLLRLSQCPSGMLPSDFRLIAGLHFATSSIDQFAVAVPPCNLNLHPQTSSVSSSAWLAIHQTSSRQNAHQWKFMLLSPTAIAQNQPSNTVSLVPYQQMAPTENLVHRADSTVVARIPNTHVHHRQILIIFRDHSWLPNNLMP